MTLSDDDFVQTNSGSVINGTSIVVTLPVGTTVDNTLVVFIYSASSVSGLPTDFIADSTGSQTINVYHRPNVPAGETSWTFTQGTADANWIVLEMSGLDPVAPFDVTANSGGAQSKSNGGTLSTATTAYTGGLSTVAFACWGAGVLSGTPTKSWGSYTNGFEERAQVDATGSSRLCLAVTSKFADGAAATYESTGTLTISTGSAQCRAKVVSFREVGAPIAAPLGYFTGFEFGTHGGFQDVTGSSNYDLLLAGSTDTPVGTWGTHYLVQAGSARNGGYGLRIDTSAATCNIPISTLPVTRVPAFAFNVRVVSASGTPTLFTVDTTATDLLVLYDAATEKVGLQWSGGSTEWQTGTTPLNTWATVAFRCQLDSTTHHADWWVESGEGDGSQTSPADLTGQSATTNVTKATLSGLGSQTITMDIDDYLFTRYYAAHPLIEHKVVLLKVDQTATPTISGTTGNFQISANNGGTMAAWNATTARGYLDDVPPTVSASADVVAQITTAAGDYMEFPMETYTLAADEAIAGVKMVACVWGGTGSGTGTLAIKGWDGTTETSLVPTSIIYDAGSPTALSAVAPMWQTAMWDSGPGWTQAELNAAALRVGYSTDATPDMGVNALYLEVAIRPVLPPVVVHRLTDDEDPEAVAAVVTELLHPYSSGVRSFTVSNDDYTRTAEFRFYETGGAEHADSPVAVAPSDPPVDVVVGAEAFGEIESTSFGWQ